MQAQRPWAIVEIAGGSDEGERIELIQAAYQLSRSGLVGLALRGVSRQAVDRALDPVVDLKDPRVGVIYLDADDRSEDVLAAATHATHVIARTEEFRAELLDRGIIAMSTDEGPQALFALTGRGHAPDGFPRTE